MSTLLSPQGPESPATYWRRRAITVLAGVLVIALLWWLLALLFGDGGKQSTVSAVPENTPLSEAPSPSPSSTPTAGAASASATSAPGSPSAAVSSASPAASASVSQKPTPTPTPTPTGPVLCDPSQVTLEFTGERRPTIQKTTQWTLKLTNQQAQACRLELAKHPIDVTVTSGPALIWTSKHCAKWVPAGKVELKAKGSWQSTVSWATQRSEEGCSNPKDVLKPGTYVATASLAGGGSDRVVMLLHW